jgi:hypothetical protein
MRVWFCAYKQWFPVRCNTAAHVHRRRPVGTANAAVPGRRTEGKQFASAATGQRTKPLAR